MALAEGGFPGGASGKEFTCQCRRHKRCGFDPWVKKIPWRRKWQCTPEFLPGESHGLRNLVVYSLWDCKELDTTEWLSLSFTCFLWLAHQFPPADKQYNVCHIWRLHQRKGAAPVTCLSTDRRCLGSTVYLLHRSRQLSLHLQWLRCAGRDVWLSYSIKQSVSGLPLCPYLNKYL